MSIDPVRITRMRKLLQEATSKHATNAIAVRLFPTKFEDPVCQAIKRRSMVMQIGLATKHYDLKQDVEAYVAAAGQISVSGLNMPQLDTLCEWLSQAMDRSQVAADHPDDPPAR